MPPTLRTCSPMPVRPKFHLARLDTTRSTRSTLSSESRRSCRAVLFDKLDTDKMHGLDMSNVSCRDVTSHVELGLITVWTIVHSVNGDIAIQWEWSNFEPSQNPNPLTNFDNTLHNWLRPRDEQVTQNLCQSAVRERLAKYVKYKASLFYFFTGLAYWSN